MKIIITYASAGAGHFKAAKAIYDYLKDRSPETDTEIIDSLEKTAAFFRYAYIRGYSFTIRRAHFFWGLAYRLTDSGFFYKFIRAAVSLINRLNTKSFSDFLIRENPEFIISTHFLSSEIAAYLKKGGRIKSRLITIITDFGVHPFWISDATDIYGVACDFTERQLLLKGVDKARIKEFGIPVDTKFLKRYARAETAGKLGIDGNKFTVLIMTGSFGLGPIKDIVKLLYRDVQILVICANNKKLYTDLKKAEFPGVKVFGFVDNAHELMAVSDTIITKPGGLSISEILNMELIPVFISAIPGQERINAQALKTYGIGVSPASIPDIRNIVLDFKAHPSKLEDIKARMRKIKKPDALREIYNAVCQNSAGPAC
ncbi:MAG: glycosyltransferase [Candidatus Omnitrophota bacterium]|jgi:processive 1,2-diacylglycerol beta-glucosyltransferase